MLSITNDTMPDYYNEGDNTQNDQQSAANFKILMELNESFTNYEKKAGV